ncbi:MAG: hypothetical protein AKCLJLPJ_00067 [Fimbriimonadales bacterium]|nr:hypothetical protein [Fimbriimonadales bacterium]NOG93947.1 hypothetical protein [Armatimonadota bacterium]
MGIERNDRKPKRRRTIQQRLKGRQKSVFILPSEQAPTAPEKPKKRATKKKEEPVAE